MGCGGEGNCGCILERCSMGDYDDGGSKLGEGKRHGEQGTRNRDQGPGIREQGKREEGTGNEKELRAKSWELGTESWEQGMTGGTERRACEFQLLRYVPDAVRNEYVHIGVILREQGSPQA